MDGLTIDDDIYRDSMAARSRNVQPLLLSTVALVILQNFVILLHLLCCTLAHLVVIVTVFVRVSTYFGAFFSLA